MIRIDGSMVCKAFVISRPNRILRLNIKHKSDPVSIRIEGKNEGQHQLSLFFYYKLNLLMVLSVPLEVRSHFTHSLKSEYYILATQVIGSNEEGFECIFEIYERP